MRRAISFCVPMASIDTIAPLRLSMSRSSGIAVISLDFPSTACWAEHEPRLGGVSRNQMQPPFPVGRGLRAPPRLAVDRAHLACLSAQRGRPRGKAALQRLSVQQTEHL